MLDRKTNRVLVEDSILDEGAYMSRLKGLRKYVFITENCICLRQCHLFKMISVKL